VVGDELIHNLNLFLYFYFLWYNSSEIMKLKNVNATLLIFAGLLCLNLAFFAVALENPNGTKNVFLDSDQDGLLDTEEKTYGTNPKNPDTDNDGYSDGAEVSAGYNPLIKAPGDKLSDSAKTKTAVISDSSGEKQNLTQEVAQKISVLASQGTAEDQEMGMEDIQTILDSVMDGQDFENELPKISREDIKILEQNYGNLSKEKATERRKDDATDYAVSVLYVFASNSPEPLTSSTDTALLLNKMIEKIVSALTTGDPEILDDLSESGQKINEQLKEVEVPEDMADTQIKALQYALYAQKLKNSIKLDPTDPLANLSNYSKIGSFVESINNFYNEIQNRLEEYGIDDKEVQNRLEDQGIDGDIFGS